MRRTGRRVDVSGAPEAIRVGPWVVAPGGRSDPAFGWLLFREAFGPRAYLAVGTRDGLVALARERCDEEPVPFEWRDPDRLDDGSRVVDSGTLLAIFVRDGERRPYALPYAVVSEPGGARSLRVVGGPYGDAEVGLAPEVVDRAERDGISLGGVLVPAFEARRVLYTEHLF